MILDDIIAYKRRNLDAVREAIPLECLVTLAQQAQPTKNFSASLISGDSRRVRVIAEVKKASPSKGIIRGDADPCAIAREYEQAGAVAVSVLTEHHFFQGSLEYLAAVRQTISLPLLRKDFIIDPYQLYEARVYGADAVLLIVAALEHTRLCELLSCAQSLSLDALVEVHTRDELDRALDAGAQIVGINNRNLQTFVTDIATTISLCAAVPDDKIVVSESGIDSAEVIRRLLDVGVDAFLIGEALMRAPSPGNKLRELIGCHPVVC
ncbi:MAG: indole-3-glycerol phosphate synthase TrpC [Desulfobacterota bacterium]|nr:indole-3-glycerol phosphate synthase TrpC [Thermodesulfobacteriota bacterium]